MVRPDLERVLLRSLALLSVLVVPFGFRAGRVHRDPEQHAGVLSPEYLIGAQNVARTRTTHPLRHSSHADGVRAKAIAVP